MIGIYKIINTKNNKIYVGSSVDIKKRWSTHRSKLRGSYHVNNYLQNAWNKYGEGAFEFEVIKKVNNYEELISAEQKYLEKLKPEYNIQLSAGERWGFKHSKETIEKLRKINLGGKNGNYGRKHTAKEKELMSKNHADFSGKNHPMYGTKREFTEETIERLREASAGKNNPMYGKKHNSETRRKISKAHRGKEKPEKQGSRHHNSKLTEDDVLKIRKIYKEKNTTHAKLAEKFNISRSMVGFIVRRENWKHI